MPGCTKAYAGSPLLVPQLLSAGSNVSSAKQAFSVLRVLFISFVDVLAAAGLFCMALVGRTLLPLV